MTLENGKATVVAAEKAVPTGRSLQGDAPDAAGRHKGGAAKKRPKKRLLVALALVVALAAGGGYAVIGRHHEGRRARPAAGPVAVLGTLTVNTSDGALLEVGVDLQLAPGVKPELVTTSHPQLDNATIADVDRFSYAELLDPQGRSSLQHALLTSYQQVLGKTASGTQEVTGVYFTAFVMQPS
jgi:flagellar basal body-associated protein FliL